ncbi:hypothetical protein LTR56_008109 [Elasticomyces elasticus]|nr:hypothetical protein LTR56_008109 [Elasticomyces elasticus]KAK3662861.1 hypothetical protein LTR22_006264 [Elasticomyces elasticus]KAK4930056.1 hypothetical protein LTR49_003384 [Elasticomyces elasticus]KAK5763563.1 hypothetical protein LTS12_006334 [Elasticomyces elasticus]
MAPMGDFCEMINGEKLIVKVGSGHGTKTSTVPKALLCKVACFAVAFKAGRFLEATTGYATLPDDHPQAFEALLYYLYHGELEFSDIGNATTDPQLSIELETCRQIWVFGDKYELSAVQNALILGMCELMTHRTPRWAKPGEQFDNRKLEITFATLELYLGAEASPLRKLMVDYIVLQVMDKHVPFSHFKIFNVHGGFTEDYASAQVAYSSNQCHEAGTNFPRYLQPYKYDELYRVDELAGREDGRNVANDLTSIQYGDVSQQSRRAWYQSEEKCKECTKGAEAWVVCTYCGKGQPNECNFCRQRCFFQLCMDCGDTYGKTSVAQEAAQEAHAEAHLEPMEQNISHAVVGDTIRTGGTVGL